MWIQMNQRKSILTNQNAWKSQQQINKIGAMVRKMFMGLDKEIIF